MSPEQLMQEALIEAKLAATQGEVPVGAILVLPDHSLLRAHNTKEHTANPTDHAEMRIMKEAANRLGDWRLDQCDLYVTLEPCPMCLGTMLQTRLRTLYFGASDPKRSPGDWQKGNSTLVWPTLKYMDSMQGNNHELQIRGGYLENDCAQLLKEFFALRR